MGNLRQAFSDLQLPPSLSVLDLCDFLCVVVSREEIQAMDTSEVLGTLRRLTESPEIAREFVEHVDISFDGYNHTHQELSEIPEVRDFVYKLDEEFPYWLYFLSKKHSGLQCILFCLLTPFLTEEARSKILPEQIAWLLLNRWFPAMNHICEYVGFSMVQIEELTDRAMAYIASGKFPADAKPFGR